MKKIIPFIILLSFLFSGNAWSQPQKINVDGQELKLEKPAVLLYNRTLVPLRAICNKLGAEVKFNGEKEISILKESKTIHLVLGSNRATINNNEYIMEIEPQLINDTTYVPLRFISEALECQVMYDKEKEIINVSSKGSSKLIIEDQLTKVHYLNVGYGDCTYIDLPGNNDVLIDSGSSTRADTVIGYLAKQNVKDIELLIVTHPHEDHIGAIPAIAKEVPIKKVIDNGVVVPHEYYKNYRRAIWDKRDGNPDIKKTIKMGEAVIEILPPSVSYFTNYNNSSLGVRVKVGNVAFFFAGDFEELVENEIKGNIKSQFLKVGHHGSGEATSTDFIKKVSPDVAVISVGSNPYGFPSNNVIARLQKEGARVFRTDVNGNITVITNGNDYNIITEKGTEADLITNPEQDSIQNRGEVVASDEDKFYHKPDCKLIKDLNVENQVWFENSLKARGSGYIPCSDCDPK